MEETITNSLAEQLGGSRALDPDINLHHNTSSEYYDENSFNELVKNKVITQNNFSMTFLNIRSAMKNLESFKNYLDILNIHFSIIGLAETWLNQDLEALCHIPNYKSHYLSRRNRHGGGIGLLVISSVSNTDLIWTFSMSISNAPSSK